MAIKNLLFRKSAVLAVALIVCATIAVALVAYSDWGDLSTSKDIDKGQSGSFDVALVTASPPMYYSVKMYDPDNNLVKTWYNDEMTNEYSVEETLQVTPADYNKGGDYLIIINAHDSSGIYRSAQISLNVNNHAPEITSVTAPNFINEGQTLTVSFTATDEDNDPLTYSIYRDGELISSTNQNLWQTDYKDAGRYNYTFTVSDGEAEDTATRMINVLDVPGETDGGNGNETEDNYVRIYNLEFALMNMPDGNYLLVRNLAHPTDGTTIKVNAVEINSIETFKLNLDQNRVALLPLTSDFKENNTYLLKIDVTSTDFEGSDYLLLYT